MNITSFFTIKLTTAFIEVSTLELLLYHWNIINILLVRVFHNFC